MAAFESCHVVTDAAARKVADTNGGKIFVMSSVDYDGIHLVAETRKPILRGPSCGTCNKTPACPVNCNFLPAEDRLLLQRWCKLVKIRMKGGTEFHGDRERNGFRKTGNCCLLRSSRHGRCARRSHRW